MWRFFLFIAYSTLRKHKNHIVASNIFQSCSLYMVAWKQPVCEWLSITSRPLSLAMIHQLGIPTPESCWNRATCKSIPGFRLNLTILKGRYLPCFLHHGVPPRVWRRFNFGPNTLILHVKVDASHYCQPSQLAST
jgi:hypothetical protein